MANKPYHHGNLRETLIEAGIELINRHGVDLFSLRKVAAECGVSHAAPYSHFKDKEELLQAMKQHVMEKFTAVLADAAEQYAGDPAVSVRLGRAYVAFFVKHPPYYSFLFNRSGIHIALTHKPAEEGEPSYPPFEVFKRVALDMMEQIGLPEEKRFQALVAMWSVVHGIAALAAMQGVHYEGDWEKLTDAILIDNLTIGSVPGTQPCE